MNENEFDSIFNHFSSIKESTNWMLKMLISAPHRKRFQVVSSALEEKITKKFSRKTWKKRKRATKKRNKWIWIHSKVLLHHLDYRFTFFVFGFLFVWLPFCLVTRIAIHLRIWKEKQKHHQMTNGIHATNNKGKETFSYSLGWALLLLKRLKMATLSHSGIRWFPFQTSKPYWKQFFPILFAKFFHIQFQWIGLDEWVCVLNAHTNAMHIVHRLWKRLTMRPGWNLQPS